jgi:hypothetical protein
MEDKIRELEIQIMSLTFMNELLMDKVGVTTEEIKNFAKKCLENMDSSEKNTDMYFSLMGFAYQEEASEMLQKEFLRKSFQKDQN